MVYIGFRFINESIFYNLCILISEKRKYLCPAQENVKMEIAVEA